MWISLNDGFVSAVEDWSDENMLVVRARRYEHLENLGTGYEIEEDLTGKKDYKYRMRIPKQEFSELIADRIKKIDYFNFKNSVKDKELHDAYLKVWSIMYDLQNDEYPWWLHYRTLSNDIKEN